MPRTALIALVAAAGLGAAQAATAGESTMTMQAPLRIAQAQEAAPMPGADTEDMEALTNEVINNLKGLGGGVEEDAGKMDNLMQSLSNLVEKAMQEGKSSTDIVQIIEEALQKKGGTSLEELMAKTGGKVDMRALLNMLVQKAAEKAAAGAGGEDALTRALEAESAQTRMDTAATGGGGRVITVQPGETLGTIAVKYYGSAARWRDIYNANRDRLKNPDLVPSGMRLRLP